MFHEIFHNASQTFDSVIQVWTTYGFCVCRRMIGGRASAKMNRCRDGGGGSDERKMFQFIYVAQTAGLGALIRTLHDHTQAHHNRYYSSGRVISLALILLPDKTQHSQETGVHVHGGIRTHNSSKRAAAHPRLRPRGYWELIGFGRII
jgi:hypothetical protein